MPAQITQRLVLRELSLNQLRLLVSDQDHFKQELNIGLADAVLDENVSDALNFVVSLFNGKENEFGPWSTFWLMILKEKRDGIGLIGFKGTPDIRGDVEVGYGIAPAWRRKGLTTEALLGMLTWAFDQPGCKAVRADCYQTNKASIRVLEKAGFHLVARKANMLGWIYEKESWKTRNKKSSLLQEYL